MQQLADTLAREHTTEAIGRVVDVMRSDDSDPREILAAAALLLDRGHGKPTSTVITLPANPKTADRLATMSDADLLAAVGAARLARQRALPAIETSVEEDYSADPLCG